MDVRLAVLRGIIEESGYERAALARVEEALEAEFAGRVPARAVHATVAEVHRRFRDARLREYVPLLVHRVARGRLTALAACARQPVGAGTR